MNMTTLFANYGVKKRVAVSLLVLNRVYARKNSETKTVITISREDLACYVGTAKETLVRMLRFFKDEGIISAKRTNITVLKPGVLLTMAQSL
jgi:CRP-like cAMP-binding protein